MIHLYSTKSGTRRWLMHVFFNVLDISAINAWILYKEVTGKKKLSRRNFILQLCEKLRAPYASSRNTANARKPMEQSVNREETIQRRTKCRVKLSCKRNHTWKTCPDCKIAVCSKCASREVGCIDCYENSTK
ncbi:hypothetical protein AVEN_200654-1 [Araneus ventricosus]|uniref:PiggyBac transposable element-derived protein domain-containing protein n=1 Tax=Araneus ventricosus TaxID=182803 RepID=A0A4Y2L668_ARAVE|nr:hypothetical protein AVEN_200654-1 [Araneus ventricosus]